jgi:hypothetical protein
MPYKLKAHWSLSGALARPCLNVVVVQIYFILVNLAGQNNKTYKFVLQEKYMCGLGKIFFSRPIFFFFHGKIQFHLGFSKSLQQFKTENIFKFLKLFLFLGIKQIFGWPAPFLHVRYMAP